MEIKRNNPGNIRKAKTFAWQGEQPGIKPGDFVIFDSLVNGYRAQIKLLSNYIKNGHDTLTKIITRYAPPSDNNPTSDYIKYVSNRTGISPNVKLSATDYDTITKVALTMSFFEHGIKSDDGTLTAAIQGARAILLKMGKTAINNPLITAAIIATIYFIVTTNHK